MGNMDADPCQLALLARLLRAELPAQPAPATAILERYRRSARFQPGRAKHYEVLSQALNLAARQPAAGASAAAPVVMVCESRPFEPDVGSLHEQVLVRLLASLEAAGMPGWVLRLHVRPRALRQRLGQLPARPSAIVAMGVTDSACLEMLREVAPVVQLGMRSLPVRGVACVQYDTAMEAYAIASYAAAHKLEQISLIAPIDRAAGRRWLANEDAAVLAGLIRQAKGWNISLPGRLTFWVDTGLSLRAAEVLSKVAAPLPPHVLAVVSGTVWAQELAGLSGVDARHIVCRHWSAEGTAKMPVIGPDLEQLAEILLARALKRDGLPAEATVLVPPTWHRQ